jgi:hypothetical protein
MELRYLRDTDGREVDFVVVRDTKPMFAVECKTGDKGPSARFKEGRSWYYLSRTSARS